MWQKSSYCMVPDQTCVEAAIDGLTVLVRDSKDPDGPVLRFSIGEWVTHMRGIQNHEFEIAKLAELTGAAP